MKYKVNKNIVLQKIDKGIAAFDVDRSLLYTFNETAGFIYKKIKQGWEEEKIVLALAKKYDAVLPTIEKDVKVLVKDMLKNKIIISTFSK